MRGNTGNRPTCRRPCPPKPRMSKPLPVTSDAHNHRMQPRPRRAEIHRAGHRAGRPICASMTRVTEKERCKETRVADPPAHDHDPAHPLGCPQPPDATKATKGRDSPSRPQSWASNLRLSDSGARPAPAEAKPLIQTVSFVDE